MTRPLLLFTIVAFAAVAPASAVDTDTATVTVTVQIANRTSLHVSGELLQFDVADPDQSATAAVEFSAAARTAVGNDVVLTVEPLAALDGPGGAADVEATVAFSGDGAGTLTGTLSPASPSIAGRWHGSGVRTGRLLFALRASASGTYTLPVRVVLSTP